jgi:hypothetical protein
LPDLIGNRQGHFLAAQADVGAPHAAHRIEKALAFTVVDIRAVAGDDVQRAVLPVLIEHVVAVHVVGLVGLDQLGVIELVEELGVGCGHGKGLEGDDQSAGIIKVGASRH